MTRTQLEALRRIRDGGSGAWCGGRRRSGGAVSRMFKQLVRLGYCSTPPHEITAAGRKLLQDAGL